ncbi:Fc receptor-like protein 5 [Spea bombifrons]|uniref:Fc receptor-like protein 5 n=1 Tax=Spea bombifrons TaxID=233779 RepID=UPI00234A77DF|nr:Fc receptor-like protein 5 [Spea bombifrons]
MAGPRGGWSQGTVTQLPCRKTHLAVLSFGSSRDGHVGAANDLTVKENQKIFPQKLDGGVAMQVCVTVLQEQECLMKTGTVGGRQPVNENQKGEAASLNSGQAILIISGAADKAVVSVTPNWTKILQGDAVTLTCILPSAAQEYFWFKDDQQIHQNSKTLSTQSASSEKSGEYRCQGRHTERSDPVRLDIVNSAVILQIPPSIYEGDTVSLRCHSAPGYSARSPTLYKDDDTVVQYTNSLYLVKDIRMSAAGRYSCTKEIYAYGRYQTYRSSEETLSIKELFSIPQINARPQGTSEGTNVTLTCNTTLSPPRRGTQLQFAFYKDGERVQDFDISNTYQLWSARPEDSGSYTCKVKTATNICKTSNSIHVTIQELFTFPKVRANAELAIEGAEMTLTCDATGPRATELQYAFYRDEHIVKGFGPSNEYQVHVAKSNDSGLYACVVKTSRSNIIKRSIAVTIQVQELFSDPEIEVSPPTISEGVNMTLTCNATRRSVRDTEIQFAFYKNGEIVQDFGLSNKYHVSSAKPEEGGNYVCEARALSFSVKRISNVLSIQVQAKYTGPDYLLPGLIATLSAFLLVAVILMIVFRRRVTRSFKKQQEVREKKDLGFPEARVRPENEKAPKPGSTHTGDRTEPAQEEELCYADIKINSTNKEQLVFSVISSYQNLSSIFGDSSYEPMDGESTTIQK